MSFRRLIIPLAVVLTACSSGGDSRTAVPKPEAWPRVEVYPPDYQPLANAPLHFEANRALQPLPSEHPGWWFSMAYPRYGATLFITFTKAGSYDEQQQIVANRLERMQMNAGSASSQLTRLTSEGGFDAQLLTTRHGSSTPVQLLAVGDGWVVSGAVALSNPADITRPDSLAPVIDAVEADLLHALKHLKQK